MAASESSPLRLYSVLLVAGLVAACANREPAPQAAPETLSDAEVIDHARAWRERREARLTEPYGWLSLIGLEFLDDGVTRVGAAADNDLVVPDGPPVWGELDVDGNNVLFKAEPGADISIDGEVRDAARLLLDGADGPTTVSAGTVRFHLIGRGDGVALRLRDSRAPTRRNFAGLDWYAPDPDWRIRARWEPHPPGSTMQIANVLGDLLDEPNPGRAVFKRNGRSYSLEAVDSGDDVWFIFADRTSGRSTYGSGRFLYADKAVDGELVLDFNLAYNPPCAFNEYTTCPLPPPSNRLDLAVEAGERKYPGGDY